MGLTGHPGRVREAGAVRSKTLGPYSLRTLRLAGLCGPLIERHVSQEWLRTGFREAGNQDQLHDEVRRAGPMPDVPLIVLAGTGIDAFKRAVSPGTTESALRAEIDGKLRLYQEWTNSFPRGECRVIAGAGHASFHWSHPDAVVRAIHDLLGK